MNTKSGQYVAIINGHSRKLAGNGSSDNLTLEDIHMLKHTKRQEPQGEEQIYVSGTGIGTISTQGHQISSYNPMMQSHPNNPLQAIRLPVTVAAPQNTGTSTSHRSIESNMSSGDSNSNTLIIHHSVPDEQWTSRWLSGYSTPCTPRTQSTTQGRQQYSEPPPGAQFTNHANSNFNIRGSDSLKNTSMANTSLNSPSVDSSFGGQKISTSTYIHQSQLSPSVYRGAVKTPLINEGINDNLYSNQSEILKHLMNSKEHAAYSDQSTSSSSSGLNLIAESGSNSSRASHVGVTQAAINPSSVRQVIGQLEQSANRDELTDREFDTLVAKLPPPPAYPHWRSKGDGAKNPSSPQSGQMEDRPNLSRSQPDLTKIGSNKDAGSARLSATMPLDDECCDPTSLKDNMNILMQENRALKMALEIHRSKISKLQKFEKEMAKVEEHHDALMKLSERREHLERIARHKLQTDVKALQTVVVDLRERLREQCEALNAASEAAAAGSADAATNSGPVASLQRELNRRDVCIAQLVSQNKELIAGKERQEIELCAQRQTLNEQRTHIDLLDNALTNAQTNVIKLEEEVRQKNALSDQCSQLKRLLLSMRLTSDRREQAEKNLRHNLEMDILQLKSNTKLTHSSNPPLLGVTQQFTIFVLKESA